MTRRVFDLLVIKSGRIAMPHYDHCASFEPNYMLPFYNENTKGVLCVYMKKGV
jgi:hypothetical protein